MFCQFLLDRVTGNEGEAPVQDNDRILGVDNVTATETGLTVHVTCASGRTLHGQVSSRRLRAVVRGSAWLPCCE
jgi:hypothetical protein